MANKEQLAILRQGVDRWNNWREGKRNLNIDLSNIDLSGADLQGVNFRGVNLYKTNLSGANLNIRRPSSSNPSRSARSRPDQAISFGLGLAVGTGPSVTNVQTVKLIDRLSKTGYMPTNLHRADLREADLSQAELTGADLSGANLRKAKLTRANLHRANLSGANLSEADLTRAFLGEADVSRADFRRANLTGMILVNAQVNRAKLSGSSVYAVNIWDLQGRFDEQKDLIITRGDRPIVTVDNIEIAQFIYLILNNEKIRDVINTLTSKSVLILGRFSIPERKAILNALRNKLREFDLVPIVFDFDRPTNKDFTETIKTLAGLSYFVIADITNPKSSPLELQATVPDYQIPFVPIIQEGESPFAMMVDLQKKYNWVLKTVTYDSMETLMEILKPLIIDPAMKKRQKLSLIKAKEPGVISGKDFLKKRKKGKR